MSAGFEEVVYIVLKAPGLVQLLPLQAAVQSVVVITKKERQQKPVDSTFLTELQKLNPDKDVEREAKHAQSWLLSHPERKYSRAFLSAWVIRSKNVVDQNPYRQSF